MVYWLSKKSVLENIVGGNQKIGIIRLIFATILLWNLINWIPYHALKVSLMQYQDNSSTDFCPTSHVALPSAIYSPYISRFCFDRLTTKTLQSPAVQTVTLCQFLGTQCRLLHNVTYFVQLYLNLIDTQ
jgi:hypothetical protein